MSSYYVFHEDKIEQAIEEWTIQEDKVSAQLKERLHLTVVGLSGELLTALREDAVRSFLRSETLKRLEMRKD